jgi:hypothetical protein
MQLSLPWKNLESRWFLQVMVDSQWAQRVSKNKSTSQDKQVSRFSTKEPFVLTDIQVFVTVYQINPVVVLRELAGLFKPSLLDKSSDHIIK